MTQKPVPAVGDTFRTKSGSFPYTVTTATEHIVIGRDVKGRARFFQGAEIAALRFETTEEA